MSVTQTRLDNYLAAEARILARGSSQRMGERQRQEAELDTIRKQIEILQRQVASEVPGAIGRGSLCQRTVVFNR